MDSHSDYSANQRAVPNFVCIFFNLNRFWQISVLNSPSSLITVLHTSVARQF